MQSSDGVFKENVYWKSNVSFKKETEKIVLLQMKDLIHFIVKFRTKKICEHFYHLPVILLIGEPLNIAIGHLMISEKSSMLWRTLSSPWWCTHVPRVSVNKAYKKIVYKYLQVF